MSKVAVVTGGSRGIGSAIVEELALQGYKVMVGCFKHTFDFDSIRDQVLSVRADVSDYEQAKFLIDTTLSAYGKIDVLVNCAGIHQDSTVAKMSTHDWQRVLDVNLTGTFNCIKAALPAMKARKWGRIINISSVAGWVGVFGAANYAASKAGIHGLTKSVAREVARDGITVNAVALGYFSVGMGGRLPDIFKDKLVKNIPLARFGRVNEAMAPVLFLASDGASYITGQVIHVNGGYYV